MRNLFSAGYSGAIMPVNPKHSVVSGVIAYPSVEALPEAPDLAVIVTPAATVPDILSALEARGTRAVVVISAGFTDDAGPVPRSSLLRHLRATDMRLIGPNCLGVLSSPKQINASFAHLHAPPGQLAFVTQSGAIATSMLDWGHDRGIGFSHLICLGDMLDVDFGDLLDHLASDPSTRAILLYIEGITATRKFISAARIAARAKPVILVKGGRAEAGARAAASHTGALAGNDAVYEAVFRRSGLLRVQSLEDLFGAAELLAKLPPPSGLNVAIVTNGGGIGVLATDALVAGGGALAPLTDSTRQALTATLPATGPSCNPIDLIGDAPPARYAIALETLAGDPTVDAILALNCPTAATSSVAAADALITAWHRAGNPALLTSWVGETSAETARHRFASHGIPTYRTPEQAIAALVYLVQYRRSQELLMQTPRSIPEAFTADTTSARSLVRRVTHQGRDWLAPTEVKRLLQAYQIPVVSGQQVEGAEAAAAAAKTLGQPVAIKIVSPQIPHKSDVGGVVLDLSTPAAVEEEARAMLARVAELRPDAVVEGLLVEPMINRRDQWELIIGATVDSQFGPVLMFGQGGTAVELIRDQSLELPPLNMRLAEALIDRTKVSRLLSGYRGRPAANRDQLALTLIKVSQLICDLPEVVDLDINPLLAYPGGVLALDARVRVAPASGSASARLAIRPYPTELERCVKTKDGHGLLLRPVRPEDEPMLARAFQALTPEQVRMRFFVPIKTLSHMQTARFTQIDYDREMALVLTDPGIAGTTRIYGAVRIFADSNLEHAEFAIVLDPEVTGQGLGRFLMQCIIEYAQHRGLASLYGDVLRENRTMLGLARSLGFNPSAHPDSSDLLRIRLCL